MVAINEILLPECTGDGCGGDNEICTDSRVHHRKAENRAPVTRNRRSAPILGRWMEQDPAQFINGANTYQFVDSSPVGNVDAEGLSWWDWMFQPGTSYGYMGMGGTIRSSAPSPTLGGLVSGLGQAATAVALAMQYWGNTLLTGVFGFAHEGGLPIDNWWPGSPMYEMVVQSQQATAVAQALSRRLRRIVVSYFKANPRATRLSLDFNYSFPSEFGTSFTPPGIIQNMMLGRVDFHVTGTLTATTACSAAGLEVRYSYGPTWWIKDLYHFTHSPNEAGDFWNLIRWRSPEVEDSVLLPAAQ